MVVVSHEKEKCVELGTELNRSDETIALENFLLLFLSPVLKSALKLCSGKLHNASLVMVPVKLKMTGQRVVRRHVKESEIS